MLAPFISINYFMSGPSLSVALLHNDSMNFTESQQALSLLEKLQNQRESGRFCDVILHVRGRRFHAHRSVLAASSPYFDSVLKMHKAVREQLIIACQNHEVFQLLLNYMYTGHILIDKENVLELLKLANHFLVAKLKTHCAEYLERNMNLGNCLSVKDMAEKYTMPTLLKTATDYIHEHMKEALQHADLLNYKLTKVEEFLSEKSWTISYDFMLQFIARWVGHDTTRRQRDLRRLLTFLDFRNFDQTALVKYLQNETLYKENPCCLFYFLQCLHEHRLMPSVFEERYSALKKEFRAMTERVDDNSFMNIAISAAIEGVQTTIASPSVTEGNVDTAEPVNVTLIKNRLETELNSGDEDSDSGSCDNGVDDTHVVSKYTLPESAATTLRVTRAAALRQRNESMAIHIQKQKTKHQPQDQTPVTKPQKVISPPYITTVTPSTPTESVPPKRRRGRPPKNPKPPKPQVPQIVVPVKAEETNHYESMDEEDLDNDDIDIQMKSDIDDDDFSLDEEDEEQDLDHLVMQWRDGIKCPLCSFVGFSSMRMEQHISRAHAKDMTYKCAICGYNCKWNREYYRHMKSHFVGPPYNCESCDYTCERIQYMLSHRMKHTDERPFRCGECKFTSRTKSNLIVHMRCHTGEKPYPCPHCSKRFTMKSTLDQHALSHRKDRPFLCDSCGFATKYQSHLISHMRIHSGDVFYCDFPNCNYSSPKRSQVNAHARTHTAVRSHICSICGRGFVERSHLVRHERIHLNDKPFKCLECDYSSSRRDKLKEHVQKHHGENATAKAPYKPRRPRRQTFDPAFYPGRDDNLEPAHKMMMMHRPEHHRHYPLIGPHRMTQEMYSHFENHPGSSSKMGLSGEDPRHSAIMHHRGGPSYNPRDCGLMIPRERMMGIVPDMTHVSGNSENQPPEHGSHHGNDSGGGLSAFMALF